MSPFPKRTVVLGCHRPAVDFEEAERLLRDRLDAMHPRVRAELLNVLTMPDYDRAGRIGEYDGDRGRGRSPSF